MSNLDSGRSPNRGLAMVVILNNHDRQQFRQNVYFSLDQLGSEA